MKRQLLEWLACPQCGARLSVERVDEEAPPARGQPPELRAGRLVCEQGHGFPVTAFVPDLRVSQERDQAATSQHYSALWDVHVRGLAAPSVTARGTASEAATGRPAPSSVLEALPAEEASVPDEWLDASHAAAVARTTPLTRAGQDAVCLDAGCGDGIDLLWLARRAGTAACIGLDLSEGVYLAQRRAATLPHVHVVRGSVLAPPFRASCVDLLYSYGVLHHTPDPAAAFARLAACVRPGGRTFLYVYSDLREEPLLRLALWPVTGLRAWTAARSPRQLHWLALSGSPLVFATFGLCAQLLRATGHPRQADRLPFNWVRRPLGAYGDLFDRFGAQYESRHNPRELSGWFRTSQHQAIQWTRLPDRRGWLVWGQKPPAL